MEFRLEHGERITASVRKHWFVLLLELLPFALLAWVPMLIIPFVSSVVSSVSIASSTSASAVDLFSSLSFEGGWVQFLYGLWLLVMWIGAFNTFTRYYLNMWVITTTRIVYIHQHGFFSREVSSFLLVRVQDVTTEVHGLFGTLLGYGTLNVETAGDSSKDFKMTGIPNPTTLRDLIMKEIADLHEQGKGFHL